MNSLAMETHIQCCCQNLPRVIILNHLILIYVLKIWFPKIQIKMMLVSLVFHVNVFQGVSHSKLLVIFISKATYQSQPYYILTCILYVDQMIPRVRIG